MTLMKLFRPLFGSNLRSNVSNVIFSLLAVHLLVSLLANFFFVVPCALAERINLDIANSGIRKLVVAVPSFVDEEGDHNTATGRDIASLMKQGLQFHGFVKILDARRYDGEDTPDWHALGADYVVRGSYALVGNRMSITGSLLDVMSNNVLTEKNYTGKGRQQEKITLRLVDAMVKAFTGEPGIAQSSIAFVSDKTGRKEIYIADIFGRKVRQVTRHRHLCVSPRFTADGSQLAYTSYHRGNQDLYITRLNQNKTTRSLSRRRGMNLAPAFSPDNRTAVVTLSKDGNPDLYLIDMEGDIIKRLTRQSGINVSPSFSPDGRSICFVSDRSGSPQVYIMDLQTMDVRRLTFKGKENVEPSWSPRGDKVVYTHLTQGPYHIYTLPVNGGQPTRITSGSGSCESPTWSPDGRQIAFSRKVNGKKMQIYVVQANGEGMHRMFTFNGNQSYPRWSPPVHK
ncbi:MAG: Tol-Pal system beta propeller repeat protein TolB [Candidatus Electrothrix sp. AW1]|nr:Tol-Pal system beta propeller repeat protein TolB [Candidatus Electrothrix sp. AX1]MCI5182700.1 Tol-Pal system beta propeller repeat protein TolB [Candidatus Electrothrix gigas]